METKHSICITCEHYYPLHNMHCAYCNKNSNYKPKEEATEMAETNEAKLNYHERLIEDLKDAGKSIIDNAESIIGSERYLHQVRVTITLNPSEATMINVDRDFYPANRRNDRLDAMTAILKSSGPRED